MTRRRKFSTLEGGEGAGKSTQARLLAPWLAEKGITATLTREPGGTPSAEEIRNLLVTGEVGRWDPLTETLLHYAARREHYARLILPALDAGQWIICDRFIDSTLGLSGLRTGYRPCRYRRPAPDGTRRFYAGFDADPGRLARNPTRPNRSPAGQ